MDGKQKAEIVKFIEHYPVALRNVKAMEKKIEELDLLCFPDGIDPSKDKVTSSNTQDTVFTTAVKRDKLMRKYERIKEREERYLELHNFAFDALTDAEKTVLGKLYHGRRYADGKLWLVEHGYAYSTIYKVKNRGLKKMYRWVFGSDDYVVVRRHRENVDKT